MASVVGWAAERFEPTWESLDAYECPEWFRDAKLGIFMHWGPVSVPAYNDWYPRNMYIEGHDVYQHHVATYGHPSKFGYKDFIPLWKAGKFDPERLAALYKEAGARYVVPVAVHHDNFDLWDSKHHRWNSVAMGPRKNIIGMWREAVLKQGMRFGVSVHLARSYSWLNVSKGSDKSGPLAGVPYDGADPANADYYHEPHADTSPAYPVNPSEAWKQIWYNRTKDLVDRYRPDLLYFDGGVPFGETGLRMVSHFYNANMDWHGGKLEAVLNIKDMQNRENHGDYRDGMCVLDMERGVLEGIREEPWQNDTSIGPWYYKEGAAYKSVDSIVDGFVDIVSKGGNLLLNVPLRADGSLDAEAEEILRRLGQWLRSNGDAIYGTRPWKLYGEGPTQAPAGNFQERTEPFTERDFRFTTKGTSLYAICLGWPGDGTTVVIRSITKAEMVPGVRRVRLLGHDGELQWSLESGGLEVRLPNQRPGDYAYSLQIELEPAVAGSGAPRVPELASR
jgi:alpha-L-fucosidase